MKGWFTRLLAAMTDAAPQKPDEHYNPLHDEPCKTTCKAYALVLCLQQGQCQIARLHIDAERAKAVLADRGLADMAYGEWRIYHYHATGIDPGPEAKSSG